MCGEKEQKKNDERKTDMEKKRERKKERKKEKERRQTKIHCLFLFLCTHICLSLAEAGRSQQIKTEELRSQYEAVSRELNQVRSACSNLELRALKAQQQQQQMLADSQQREELQRLLVQMEGYLEKKGGGSSALGRRNWKQR